MPGISESERALFLVQSSLGALDTAVQPLDQEAQRQLASKLDRAALVRAQDAISNLLGLHDADAPKGRPPTHPPAAEGSPHVKFRNVSPASSVASSPGSATGAFRDEDPEAYPSFVLVDVDGPRATCYVYELRGEEVKVDKVEYSKA